MIQTLNNSIIEEYAAFLHAKEFPCIAARASIAKKQVKCFVADHMACSKDDEKIVEFLYDFIHSYRSSSEFFHSASIIFKEPVTLDEEMFDALLWQRLQAFMDLDARQYSYDKRVVSDPASPHFSFSLKEEAFFIIGLHPASSRPARQFKYPTLAFNPHAQFEQLRETNRYDKMKNIVRKRDMVYSGSINAMLVDYGESSEVRQYSGRLYDNQWQCPLKNKYEPGEDHSST